MPGIKMPILNPTEIPSAVKYIKHSFYLINGAESVQVISRISDKDSVCTSLVGGSFWTHRVAYE